MSKFSKKKKEIPAVNTASLPDIVFMLLFFFMVTTTMRDTDLLIVEPIYPEASEVVKLEDKSLVSNVYVGKSKKGIKGDRIQLNDKIASVKDIKNFIISKRESVSQGEVNRLITSIKADVGTEVGTIYDIKYELRKINALKINYNAKQVAPTK